MVLVTLSHTVKQKRPNGMEIEATTEELANTACVTQFTASRLLSITGSVAAQGDCDSYGASQSRA